MLGNLSELNLDHNGIFFLRDVSYELPVLRYLSLADNRLEYLDNGSFWWTPALSGLSLADNILETMHVSAFSHSHALRHLDLSHNRLREINPYWFENLGLLETLILDNNDVHVLRNKVFHALGHLRVLSLKGNKLQTVEDAAFVGLGTMDFVSLMTNDLREIPGTALRGIPGIAQLDLGSNLLERLTTGSFVNLTVGRLKLNNMSRLLMIDENAFSNLSSLFHLEIRGNRKLQYVDRKAFHAVPSLRLLSLQHNNLSVIEEDIYYSLPGLTTLEMEGNPLYCDCMIHWLLRHVNVTFRDAHVTFCAGPTSLSGLSLSDLTDDNLGHRYCAPRIIPLFSPTYNLVLADDLRLDCKAVGQPTPHTHWLLPPDALSAYSENHFASVDIPHHFRLNGSSTLFIEFIQGTDVGSYTCVASNEIGIHRRSAVIVIRNANANPVVLRVGIHSVTVTWRSAHYLHDYKLQYRQAHTNRTYHTIEIKSYMRSFTITQLLPHIVYDFCLAAKHGPKTIKLNCTTVRTKPARSSQAGIVDVRKYVIGITMSLMAVVVFGVCLSAMFVRRYGRRSRRLHDDLYADNMADLFLASGDGVSDTTPMNLENRAADMFDEDDLDDLDGSASHR